MKLRESALAGTGKVFRFSLQQYFKSAATYVMLAIMMLGAAGSVLMMSLGMSRGEEMGSDAKTVYILNGSPYAIDPAGMPDYVEARLTGENMEDVLRRLDAGETDGVAVGIDVDGETGLWKVTAYTGEKSEVTQGEARNLAACCAALVEEARYEAMGVSPLQMGIALAPISSSTVSEADYRETEDDEAQSARQVGGSAYSILIFMLVSFSTSFIVRAVVQEKSSKLVELLMVSVKPLALITGKILAAMCLVVAGMLCSGLGLILARTVMKLLGKGSGIATAGIGSLLRGLTGPGVLAVLVSVLLGYLSYAIISGISGACCSTETESDSASSGAMLISMVGYMAGMATAWMKAGTAIRILCVIPFVSVYIAPSRFLMGDIGFGWLALGWLLQALVALLLMKLCAAVYGALMIHRGERVKPRQILAMMKGGARS
ncbi:MAG: ABC transporter permease [Oscillospiraceae bacterium]|nr:ABC transporter permease [Oscillospiraceae bacterium]